MAYKGAVMVDDETLFKTMEVARETGGLVMVHAENGDAIDVIVKKAVAEGKTDPIWHARTRPMETEAGDEPRRPAGARRRLPALRRPRFVPACRGADRARAGEGLGRGGETCTQYLFVDERVEQPDWEGAKYLHAAAASEGSTRSTCGRRSSRRPLGRLHRPLPLQLADQKGVNGREFEKVPNGGPGIENRLHMLHEFGVRGGRITLNRFVELTSTNVAKRFGLYPRKGRSPSGATRTSSSGTRRRSSISAQTHHTNVNYNLFEGTKVTGAPEAVLVRGQVIVENDELVAEPGAGRLVSGPASASSPRPGRRRSRHDGSGSPRGLRARPAGRERHARRAPGRPRGRLQLRLHRPGQHARLGPDRRGRGDEAAARRRDRGVPVVFTTIGFEPNRKDGALWLQKVPSLGELEVGGRWVDIDPRLERREDETVVVKKGASRSSAPT